MKKSRWIPMVTAGLLALSAAMSYAAGGGNGGGGGGNGGGGNGGGHGAGMAGAGTGANAGGMSVGHMSSKGMTNTNGFNAGDRDKGLARASDRSDTQADRASVPSGHTHARAHASTSLHHRHRSMHKAPDQLS